MERDADGNLVATLELPMPVGLIGGATKTHPTARAAVRLLGVETASELAQVIVAVGLAQNLGAVRALATEGIQRGHMTLHARNVAIAAGAEARRGRRGRAGARLRGQGAPGPRRGGARRPARRRPGVGMSVLRRIWLFALTNDQ